MLYVFHVDTGTFITFDIKIVLQSTVLELKEAIQRECGVAVEDQILLISGGDVLQSGSRVGSYNAGTDTNPIFLFSMACIRDANPPQPSLDYGSDIDLQRQVDESLSMPAAYQTLVQRSILANQCCNLAREILRICDRLVLDQHMMQQGWSAVTANHGDITQNLKDVAANLELAFNDYLKERKDYMQLLSGFRDDLEILEKIPILPALRAQALGLPSSDEEGQQKKKQQQQQEPCDQDTTAATVAIELIQESSPESAEALNLLKWISAKDQTSLQQMSDMCERGLEQFNERVLEAAKNEIENTLAQATDQNLKEIKGIEDRLFGLAKLMNEAKKIVQEQSELAQGFHQNKSRVSNLNDVSVLPDLCLSHQRQLSVMLENHNKLRDIRKRCAKSKTELVGSIHRRLKHIELAQSRITETLCKITMYGDNMRRLRRQLDILRQIHRAPEMYVSAITEVVRRRTFSEAFLGWASNLANQLVTVHNEEIERRRDFQAKFQGHFLNVLFPGLEDSPPPYATQAPPVFDNGLPKLTQDDMETLRRRLPDLAESVSSPDLSSITQFFYSKNFSDSSSSANPEKDIKSDKDLPPKEPEGPRLPLICDRGDLSETDTEEFEKIGQAAIDSKQTSFDSAKQQLQTSHQKQLEESLSNSREEVDRLRAIIRSLKDIATESLSCLRQELTSLKDQTVIDKESMVKRVEEINEAMKMHMCTLREREQELTVDHELELSDVKKLLQAKDEQVESLKKQLLDKEVQDQNKERLIVAMNQKLEDEQQELGKVHSIYRQYEEQLQQAQIEKDNLLKESNELRILETNQLKSSLEQRNENIRELEEKLLASQVEHQKALKEETEKYKTQMETIRSRFKLMAASTMERSPSDSSLEKIERFDVIELINHETILAQTKKDLETEKEEAIRLAVEQERQSLNRDLQEANEVISKHEQELDVYKQQELFWLKQQTTIKNLEMDKVKLENTIAMYTEKLEEQNKVVLELEAEKNSRMNTEVDELSRSLEESSVSESKKVKLETESDLKFARIDFLEADNKRLSEEMQTIREGKELTEAKIEALENERIRLQGELAKERSKLRELTAEMVISATTSSSREKEMSVSSASIISEAPTRVDASTSPEMTRSRHRASSREIASSVSSLKERIPKSTNTILQSRLTFTTCSTGDIVLLLWDEPHKNFLILQESSIFFFLNSECLGDLKIEITNGLPNKMWSFAEVVDKEYCSARKPENRYKVPQGTKFYRVRVKPTGVMQSLMSSCRSQEK